MLKVRRTAGPDGNPCERLELQITSTSHAHAHGELALSPMQTDAALDRSVVEVTFCHLDLIQTTSKLGQTSQKLTHLGSRAERRWYPHLVRCLHSRHVDPRSRSNACACSGHCRHDPDTGVDGKTTNGDPHRTGETPFFTWSTPPSTGTPVATDRSIFVTS